MKNIRHKVFESNSSSTHSISINPDASLLTSLAPDENGNLVLTGGQFGWEWEKYMDTLSKANYCAVAAHETYGPFKDPAKKDLLIQVLKSQTGAKEIIFDLEKNYGKSREVSYIDHQSIEDGGAIAEAFSSPENLRLFIFNPKSILYTGNDNSEPPANFYD